MYLEAVSLGYTISLYTIIRNVKHNQLILKRINFNNTNDYHSINILTNNGPFKPIFQTIYMLNIFCLRVKLGKIGTICKQINTWCSGKKFEYYCRIHVRVKVLKSCCGISKCVLQCLIFITSNLLINKIQYNFKFIVQEHYSFTSPWTNI